MRTQLLKPNLSFAAGLLFTLPTAYFILASILKYIFGFPTLFDATQSMLESWGIKESIGWNINLLILFGPIIALLLNLTAILTVEWQSVKDELLVHLRFQKRKNNWLVIVLSGLCLLTLFWYLLGENCR